MWVTLYKRPHGTENRSTLESVLALGASNRDITVIRIQTNKTHLKYIPEGLIVNKSSLAQAVVWDKNNELIHWPLGNLNEILDK